MMRRAIRGALRRTGLQPTLSAWRKRRRKREFYAQFIRKGDLCFDIGANVRDRVALFRTLGARVVAAESRSHSGRVTWSR